MALFKKILIANRGEIALRVIAACRELGIATVAVYSEADRNSLHTRFADEAVCIGPAASSASYLNIPSVISAAEITNVEAIHPGYGFLAESAYFAEVCETCNIKFIGPPPDLIRLMGDKEKARAAMQKAGLPVLPGSGKVKSTSRDLLEVARKLGYPLMIKAAGGGGGRGIRTVRSEGELLKCIEAAQIEAESAFGNADVYMEKYLASPRHIEFQVLGDQDGNLLHLGERECSIQRRYQKLVEECPSAALSQKRRLEIGAAVVEALKTVHYVNAGTVEFLFDDQGNFYFMEMNTRIQVEHPVTEMVTGIDLVRDQILIAAGERLPYRQEDVQFRGHAMECRIIAEDPVTHKPSPGKITSW
ncbi:MAG: ATP-grasp domain-containing protein, partial [Acidobacteria bacterium]|nr:ATP-grasp domain-containing protein [Acidobacteriota bacterium]